ncbi:MAG: MATE family efflux transporter [Lachnospiraceae bacterium]|nr:MATE family efflux transporter [Lachnospiraceae bacterium]
MASGRTSDMTTGNSLEKILMFALPLFIGTMFQQAYNLVDTSIAGHNLGDSAVAAIGATSALYAVVIYFASGLNSGYGIIIARIYGKKDIPKLKRAFATMLMLNVVITVLLTAIILPLLDKLLWLLDTPEEIFSQAYAYIFIIFAGMTANILYNMSAGFLRALGNSRTPLYFLIFSCGINALLDWIFIAKLGMGVEGAAYATLIATILPAAAGLWYIIRKYPDYMPEFSDFEPDGELIREMLSTGLSMALMNSVFALGSIILQKAINALGTVFIAAHTASRKIYEFLMMPLSTISTATATFTSQNYGAGKTERITAAIKKVLVIAAAWSILSATLSLSAGKIMIGRILGTADSAVISNGYLNLTMSTLFFIPLSILLVMRMSMQAMGYKVTPVISSAIELAVKTASSLWFVPVSGYKAVALTEPVTWVLCALFLLCIYRATYKDKLML